MVVDWQHRGLPVLGTLGMKQIMHESLVLSRENLFGGLSMQLC